MNLPALGCAFAPPAPTGSAQGLDPASTPAASTKAVGQQADLAALLRLAIAQKPEGHGFCENYTPGRPMVAVGG